MASAVAGSGVPTSVSTSTASGRRQQPRDIAVADLGEGLQRALQVVVGAEQRLFARGLVAEQTDGAPLPALVDQQHGAGASRDPRRPTRARRRGKLRRQVEAPPARGARRSRSVPSAARAASGRRRAIAVRRSSRPPPTPAPPSAPSRSGRLRPASATTAVSVARGTTSVTRPRRSSFSSRTGSLSAPAGWSRPSLIQTTDPGGQRFPSAERRSDAIAAARSVAHGFGRNACTISRAFAGGSWVDGSARYSSGRGRGREQNHGSSLPLGAIDDTGRATPVVRPRSSPMPSRRRSADRPDPSRPDSPGVEHRTGDAEDERKRPAPGEAPAATKAF